ncbi:MAG: integrase core domain-containing protein [Aggregatilineales bacterium]
MEEQYVADRAHLRHLLAIQPHSTVRDQQAATGRSRTWVQKWRKRLRTAPPDDEQVLQGQSRRRARPPERVSERVVERILDIRDHPPDGLRRTPGPKAILYYLRKDEALQLLSWVPRSTSTIWRILRSHGRIATKVKPPHEPLERPPPLSSWQMDFKDVTSVKPDPSGDGKLQHVVETFNVVDVGTSMVVAATVSASFNAETVLEAAVEVLETNGVPRMVTVDRDTRFVGSASGKDFPSAFVRFWQCLDVAVNICPPHRPDKNGLVERYHRSYQQECLAIDKPADVEHTETVTTRYVTHYNTERPNQAPSCGNRPPRQAFPELPRLPALPKTIDPDGWLKAINGQVYVRRVDANGMVKINNTRYYIKQAFARQYVNVVVDATGQQLRIEQHGQPLKTVPIKGLQHTVLPLDKYISLIAHEARSEARRRATAPG